MKMKQGIIVSNGFIRSAKFTALYSSLHEAARLRNIELTLRSNLDLMPLITRPEPLSVGNSALFWDKDVRLGYALEGCGMRLYNPARAIELCDDKAVTHLALMGKVPMPDTMLVPFTYPKVGYSDLSFVDEAAERLGFPMIIKECFGSFGLQVYLANNVEEAREILVKTTGAPAIMQRFVKESAGRDLRVYVVGGRAVAAITRENQSGGYIANVAQGGRATAHELSSDEERIALTAASALGLDFCGVDLLFGKDSPLLIEVNSNAHFAGLTAATGVDVAGKIIELYAESL